MASMTFNNYGNASSNAFLGDFGSREHVLQGGAMLDNTAVYSGEDAYTIKINDAAAHAGDTSVGVDALPVALPNDTELTFGGVVVKLNGAAILGATSITVDALAGEVADDATATYDATPNSFIVASGTLVGRTVAERNSGADFGPAADGDDEIYITLGDVDMDKSVEVDLVRHGTLIKTNFLPAYAAASSTIKGKLEAQYQLMLG